MLYRLTDFPEFPGDEQVTDPFFLVFPVQILSHKESGVVAETRCFVAQRKHDAALFLSQYLEGFRQFEKHLFLTDRDLDVSEFLKKIIHFPPERTDRMSFLVLRSIFIRGNDSLIAYLTRWLTNQGFVLWPESRFLDAIRKHLRTQKIPSTAMLA